MICIILYSHYIYSSINYLIQLLLCNTSFDIPCVLVSFIQQLFMGLLNNIYIYASPPLKPTLHHLIGKFL